MSDKSNVDTAALLTRAECMQILAQACGPQCVLLDYNLESATDVVGFLGEYYHLILSYAADVDENRNLLTAGAVKQQRIFIKSTSAVDIQSERVLIFRKETQLYAKLLCQLQALSNIKWSPKCYYIRDNLLALEQLQDFGHRQCPNVDVPLSQPQMQQIIRSVAAMHAASIAYEVKNQQNIGEQYADILQEITVSPQIAWYTTGLRAILAAAKLHPKFQSEELQHFIDVELPALLATVYGMTNASAIYRNVLCHRDAWRCNIFFKYDDFQQVEATGAAVFVDYQTCRYCPAAIDLVYILFMNLNSETRKLHEFEYLQLYYQHFSGDLQQFGIEAGQQLSEKQLLESYQQFKLFGFVYKCIACTILEVPRDMVTNEYKLIERTPQMLQHMQQNAKFRSSMLAHIEEILEFLLKVK